MTYKTLQIGGVNVIEDHNNRMKQEWQRNQPQLYSIIEHNLLKNPIHELPYIVSPGSARGLDLIELLGGVRKVMERCVQLGNSSDICNNITPAFFNWYDIDVDRIDLLVLSLKCIFYVEKPEDENTHMDVGFGNYDPYIASPGDSVPTLNKLLARYPYTKALCPLGRQCPYWDTTLLARFKQPYAYFVTGNAATMNDSQILIAADIINQQKQRVAEVKAKSHFHLWGHLPPSVYDIETGNFYDIQSGQFYDFNEKFRWSNPVEYYDKFFLKRRCNSQDERERWGKELNERRWRASYAYITEMCLLEAGKFYWD